MNLVATEAEEAEILCEWMRANGLFFIHVPNEGRRSIPAARRLKRQGMMAGVPDYLILSNPRAGYCVAPLWLELKREKGAGLSEKQRDFIEALRQYGYTVLVCYGAKDAMDQLQVMGY